jgi:hypothetical protein
MRDTKNWKNKVEDLRPFLKDNNNLWFSNFVDIELACSFIYDNFPEVSIYQFWSILTGYNFHIPNYDQFDYSLKNKIANIRFYLTSYKSQKRWREYLDDYLKIKKSLRLFDFDEEGILVKEKVAIIPDRFKSYQKVISTTPKHDNLENIKWLDTNEAFFKDKNTAYKVKIPNNNSNPEKKKKKYQLKLTKKEKNKNPSWSELLDTAKWIDKKRQDIEEPWRYKRLKSLKLKILEKNQFKEVDPNKELKIKKLFNIVGMLGVGKSLLIEVIAVWAAKNKLHTTLILDNVMSILSKVEFFESLDIKAAPVIGRSNLLDHNKKFQMTRDLDNLLSFNNIKKNIDSKKWLNSVCLLRSLTNINRADKDYKSTIEALFNPPCNNLYENKEDMNKRSNPKFCPFYYDCKVNTAAKKLNKADIWIASAFSFMYTKLPVQVNGKNIRFFEAIYKKSNFLLIDEADQVQLTLDSIFTNSENLTSEDNSSFIVRLENEIVNYKNKVRRHTTDNVVNTMKNMVNIAVIFSEKVHPFFEDNPDIERWIGRDFITTGRILYKLEKEQEENDKFNQKEFEKSRELISFVEKLTREDVSYKQHLDSDLLTPLFKNFNLEDTELLFKKIKFYGIIKNLEEALNFIKYNFAVLRDKLDINLENISYLGVFLDRYLPLIKEASLANISGLKYLVDYRNNPNIYYYRLKGLGRSILLEYPSLFYNADKIMGPTTILFSGSSFLPESSFFHINKKVDAILERPESEKKQINKSSFEYFDTKISVSGNTGEQRKNNLRKVVNKLLSKKTSINGVSHLESIFNNIEDKNRKSVLLVVGSYEEVDVVCKELEINLDKLDKKISAMIRDSDDKEYSYQTIHRSEISKFNELGADILVAPLMAINRGVNILNQEKNSAIGGGIFLIRNMLVPTDIINQIAYLNHWSLKNIPRLKNKNDNDWGDYFNREFRHKTMVIWKKHVSEFYNFVGLDSLDREILFSNYANILQLMNQLIGRLKRGNSEAVIALADIKYAPETSNNAFDTERTSILIGFYKLLDKYINSNDPYTREIANTLYSSTYFPLKKLINEELNYRE